MDSLVRMTSLIESMEALQQRRAKLLRNYVEIVRINIDLQKFSGKKIVFPQIESQFEPHEDFSVLPPIITRVLQDMRKDLEIIGNLKGLLVSLQQINQIEHFDYHPLKSLKDYPDHSEQLRGI